MRQNGRRVTKVYFRPKKRGQIPDIKSFLAVSPSLLTLIYTLVAFPIRIFFRWQNTEVARGVLLGIFGWAVSPGSPNPDPIDLCHASPFCLRRFKKLCLCTVSLVERTRLALHKQNETKWSPPDKGLFQTKKSHFSHPFSDLVSKKLGHHYSDKNSNKIYFLKSISKSYISLSFLLIWNWNDKYVHTRALGSYTPVVP